MFSASSKHLHPCTSLSTADRVLSDNYVQSGVSRLIMDETCQQSVCMTAVCMLDHTHIACACACSCSQASPVQLSQQLAEPAWDGKKVTANCLLDRTHPHCMLCNIINGTSSMEMLQELGGCAMHHKYHWSKGIRTFECMLIHKSSVPECVMKHFQQNIISESSQKKM